MQFDNESSALSVAICTYICSAEVFSFVRESVLSARLLLTVCVDNFRLSDDSEFCGFGGA